HSPSWSSSDDNVVGVNSYMRSLLRLVLRHGATCKMPQKRINAGVELGRPRLRAAEGAMGGGKHFKIRPPDKDDAFPHGVSTACGEATATVAVYPVQRPMPWVRIDGKQRAEFSASQPVQESRTSAGSFLRVWPPRRQ